MKVIDLLNKVAKGEKLKGAIKIKNWKYVEDKNMLYIVNATKEQLNMEVEIDNKIEEIYPLNNESDEFRLLADKINEIIEVINERRL